MDLPCVHTRICTNKNVSTVTLLKRDLHIWKETYKGDLCTWRTCLPHGVLQDVSVLQSHTHDGVRLLHAELQCVAGFRSNAHMQECVYRTMCCSIFQCVAVCFSVLQCVLVVLTVYKNASIARYVAVGCSVLQCVAVCLSYRHHIQEYVQRPRLTCHVWRVSACVSVLHARWKQRCVCTHVARSSKHVCSRHISCLQCVAACSVFWLSICLVGRNLGAFPRLSCNWPHIWMQLILCMAPDVIRGCYRNLGAPKISSFGTGGDQANPERSLIQRMLCAYSTRPI